MAAFSSSFQQHHHPHPFHLLHSSSSSSLSYLPNSSSAINFDPPFFLQNLDQAINDHPSLFTVAPNKTSMDSESVVTDKYHETSAPNPTSMDRKRKSRHSSSPNSAQSKDMRELKGKRQKKMKGSEEKEEPPAGYIHVRARRGQATDSHSLAERVRRERISERMKLLQALVPGCDKVTGKALMLDEIINYVQSLQNQVEFLSMKLASVNPISYDFGMDLESLMVRPDQSLSSLASPFPAGMHECSPTTGIAYPLLDNSANSLLLQQPNAFPQGERHVLWEVDEQRQKIINQSAISNSLFSFPLM